MADAGNSGNSPKFQIMEKVSIHCKVLQTLQEVLCEPLQKLPDGSLFGGVVGYDIRLNANVSMWPAPPWAVDQAAHYAKNESQSVDNDDTRVIDADYVSSMVNTLLQGVWSRLRGTVTIDGTMC